MTSGLRGAYGVALRGFEEQHPALPAAPGHWPVWSVAWEEEPSSAPLSRNHLPIIDNGTVVVDESAQRLTIHGMERPSPSAYLHPWLSFLATIVASRRGLTSFHAGSFGRRARAWALLGEKHAGKTTALAELSRMNCRVSSDDLVVIEDGVLLGGPGCLDLRQSAAEHLGIGDRELLLHQRERWRVWLPAPAAETVFLGFVLPAWGEKTTVEIVQPSERVGILARQRAFQTDEGGEVDLLRLAAAPMLKWTRPRRFSSSGTAAQALLDRLDDESGP